MNIEHDSSSAASPNPAQIPAALSEAASPLPPHPAPDPAPGSRRRNGKVARLPKEVRDLVNAMLEDGIPYQRIIDKIAEHGHHLNADNLSRWHHGGFQDWLKEQGWLEEMRARLDFAADVLKQDNQAMVESASLRVAVLRMYRLITLFDPAALEPTLKQQPGVYARILNVLCKLTDGAIKLQRQKEARAAKTLIFPTAPNRA